MPIAVFKNKSFQVSSKKVYTFNNFSWGGDIQSEVQEKLNSKPSTYIKGIGLGNMGFEIPLKSSLALNPKKEIEDWEAIRDSLQPAIFILGSKPLGSNKWLLKSANVSNVFIDNKGNVTEAMLKLEFEEFVRPGSAESSSSSSGASSTTSKKKAAVSANIAPGDYIYKPATKTEQTRNNPNVTSSVSKGGRVRTGTTVRGV
jgi:hypothetical protein